jgi:hypothetical protein
VAEKSEVDSRVGYGGDAAGVGHSSLGHCAADRRMTIATSAGRDVVVVGGGDVDRGPVFVPLVNSELLREGIKSYVQRIERNIDSIGITSEQANFMPVWMI